LTLLTEEVERRIEDLEKNRNVGIYDSSQELFGDLGS
jgi:hypothetical protein